MKSYEKNQNNIEQKGIGKMEIKLNTDEVYEILRKELSKKTDGLFGRLDTEDCFFNVTASGVEVGDIETVEFTGEFQHSKTLLDKTE